MVIFRSDATKRNTKMAKQQIDFLILLFLFSQILVQSMKIVEAVYLENRINPDTFYLRNFSATTAINEVLSQNWAENRECLIELNTIKNGIDRHEEWAIRGTSMSAK